MKFTVPVTSNSILVICQVSGDLKEFRSQGFPLEHKPQNFSSADVLDTVIKFVTNSDTGQKDATLNQDSHEDNSKSDQHLEANLNKTVPPVLKT